MAQTVGQHGVAAFTNPSNGDPLDATVVKANDNSVRGAYVDHDGDGGIHLQSSTLAARPVAGTVGRKWLTTDSGSVKLWFDNGSAWEEISYVPSTGNPSFTDATLNGTTTNAGTISGGTISGGTVSGGTVAPTTLTVPSGTTIPTHTETGTITATGSTRNGGTLSGATLNNTTFTGTITGISTNPTVASTELVNDVTLNYSTYTTVLTASVAAGSYLVLGRVFGTAAAPSTGTQCGLSVELANSVNSVVFRSNTYDTGTTAYSGTTNIFGTFTLSSAGTITMRALGVGGSSTPVAYGDVGSTSFTGLYVMTIA